MASKYKQSPIGIARHAWVNRPDTKYNTDGLYHLEEVVEGAEAAAFKADIDALVDQAFEAESKIALDGGMKPGELKKWGKYYPYEEETDEENGNPTGRIIFKFKQNAKIPLKDGSVKTFVMGIRDAANKPTKANVFGGATVRVMFSTRNTKLATAKQFGVRLDFCMVQLIKPAPMTGGGFDEVEGGYTDEAPTQGGSAPSANADY